MWWLTYIELKMYFIFLKDILREYPTTSISENNIRKCLLEIKFLASCSGVRLPPLKLLYFWQVAGN